MFVPRCSETGMGLIMYDFTGPLYVQVPPGVIQKLLSFCRPPARAAQPLKLCRGSGEADMAVLLLRPYMGGITAEVCYLLTPCKGCMPADAVQCAQGPTDPQEPPLGSRNDHLIKRVNLTTGKV